MIIRNHIVGPTNVCITGPNLGCVPGYSRPVRRPPGAVEALPGGAGPRAL